MAVNGAVSGAVSAIALNVMNGTPLERWTGIGKSALGGAVGGFAGGVWKSALIGAPRLGPSDPATAKRLEALAWARSNTSKRFADWDPSSVAQPVYRSGGLWAWVGLARGFAGFGRDIIINDPDDPELWIHETAHYWQFEGYGYSRALNGLVGEQLSKTTRDLFLAPLAPFIGGGYNPYETQGDLEWEASDQTQRLKDLF